MVDGTRTSGWKEREEEVETQAEERRRGGGQG